MKRVLFIFCFCLSFGFFFTELAAAQSSLFKYTIIPESPRPGEPVTIGVNTDVRQAALFANEKLLSKAAFFSVPSADGKPGFMAALLTIPSTANSGDALIKLEDETGVICEIPVTIAAREFVSEVIPLNSVLTGIRTDPDPRKTAEANRLWAILSRTGYEIFHTVKFVPPVASTRRTSFFGDRRVYKYSNGTNDTSIHAGVDFGVPTGTRVLACATGRVVLAANRVVTGNSVVIEHAPGVYSLYYHLDKIDVKEGDIVNSGELLGLSGATGLATGPHLHWEIRVNTENTDPDAFIGRHIIDKDAIISKLYSKD